MNFTKPQVLVTGLSGLIGNRFMQLYGDRYELVNLDLTNGIDITNEDQISHIFEQSAATTVIHLAAFTNVNEAYKQENDQQGVCYRVNVLGARTIAEAASRFHKHVIHISTDYVFDGSKQTPYLESDTPNPIEWYGKTKLLAEQEVEKSSASHVILRLAFPYQTRPMRPDFIANIISRLSENTLPPAFADHILTPTFVDDVAQVFDYCIHNHPNGLYHMTGSSAHTDFEIAIKVKALFQLTGEVTPGSLEDYIAKTGRPYQKCMKISNELMKRDFGINMSTLDEGLDQMSRQRDLL